MSGNFIAVREMSINLVKVGEMSKNCQGQNLGVENASVHLDSILV